MSDEQPEHPITIEPFETHKPVDNAEASPQARVEEQPAAPPVSPETRKTIREAADRRGFTGAFGAAWERTSTDALANTLQDGQADRQKLAAVFGLPNDQSVQDIVLLDAHLDEGIAAQIKKEVGSRKLPDALLISSVDGIVYVRALDPKVSLEHATYRQVAPGTIIEALNASPAARELLRAHLEKVGVSGASLMDEIPTQQPMDQSPVDSAGTPHMVGDAEGRIRFGTGKFISPQTGENFAYLDQENPGIHPENVVTLHMGPEEIDEMFATLPGSEMRARLASAEYPIGLEGASELDQRLIETRIAAAAEQAAMELSTYAFLPNTRVESRDTVDDLRSRFQPSEDMTQVAFVEHASQLAARHAEATTLAQTYVTETIQRLLGVERWNPGEFIKVLQANGVSVGDGEGALPFRSEDPNVATVDRAFRRFESAVRRRLQEDFYLQRPDEDSDPVDVIQMMQARDEMDAPDDGEREYYEGLIEEAVSGNDWRLPGERRIEDGGEVLPKHVFYRDARAATDSSSGLLILGPDESIYGYVDYELMEHGMGDGTTDVDALIDILRVKVGKRLHRKPDDIVIERAQIPKERLTGRGMRGMHSDFDCGYDLLDTGELPLEEEEDGDRDDDNDDRW